MPQILSHTPQLIEPIRINIGKMLIAHEIVKLLPDFNDYEKIKVQVNNKWSDFSNLVATRDFWNLVDAFMMGYKLKDITKDITSQNYSWSFVQNQTVDQLKFTTNINNIEANTKTAEVTRNFLKANPEELMRITNGTRDAFPENNTRHLDPIIVLSQSDGLFVHDGNGRLLRAIITDQNIISAYIGKRIPASKSNHWIPTSYLQKLADLRCRDLLLAAFQESDNAIFEFQDRVIVDKQFKLEILNR